MSEPAYDREPLSSIQQDRKRGKCSGVMHGSVVQHVQGDAAAREFAPANFMLRPFDGYRTIAPRENELVNRQGPRAPRS